MSVACHCECLSKLVFAWERNVHNDLGFFPAEFRETIHGYVLQYIDKIEKELATDLNAARTLKERMKTPITEEVVLIAKAAP